jgi:flagella basal body P-ring formation protein FlgA
MIKSCGSIFSLLCIILVLSFGETRADIHTIEIRVLPESIVYGEYYSLGDIAELDGFDIETIQKLAKVRIGKSPMPGRSLLVSHGHIRRRLKKFDDNHEFKIVLPSKPMVSRASVKIDKAQLRDLMDKEIHAEYKKYDQVKVEIKSKLRDVYLPKGNAAYEISRLGGKYRIGGNSTWCLKLLVDGVEYKKVYVRAKITVYDDVLVAKSGIEKGKKIEEADLQSIKKNVSKERIGYRTEQKLIVGQQAKRTINKNESIAKKLVQNPVLIRKGAPVKLVYKTKNLTLTNIVKALKQGKKGDVIPVRPLSGKRTIYAVVVDENNVEVAL